MPSIQPLDNYREKMPLFGLVVALMGSTAFIPSVATAAPAPSCSGLAAQLLTREGVSAATSAIQPAAGPHLSYCLVNLTISELAGPEDGYQPGQKQMIKIGIGLPLSPADSGTGGSVGAWNERIQDLGGGGYAGSVGPVTPATDFGYVGSSTDTGHPASTQGTFALNPDGTLNFGLIRDSIARPAPVAIRAPGLRVQRDSPASHLDSKSHEDVLRRGTEIHLLERLLDRWSSRSPTSAEIPQRL